MQREFCLLFTDKMFKFDFQQKDEDLTDFGGINENGLFDHLTERSLHLTRLFSTIF